MAPMIIRKNGLGDVLYAEPFARSIAQQLDRKVRFSTSEPAVFENHPLIKAICWKDPKQRGISRPIYNLDNIYESIWKRQHGYKKTTITPDDRLPLIPSVFLENYEISVPTDGMMPRLYLSTEEQDYAKKIYGHEKWVVLDPGYAKRYTFKKEEFNDVIRFIQERGYKVVRIGVGDDEKPVCHYNALDLNVDLDLRGRTTKREMFALVNACWFYMGIESSPLVVAQAFNKPGILLNGMVPSEAVLVPGCRILPHKCSNRVLNVDAVVNLMDALITNVEMDHMYMEKKSTGRTGCISP